MRAFEPVIRIVSAYLAAAIAARAPESQEPCPGQAAPPSRRLLVATAIATFGMPR